MKLLFRQKESPNKRESTKTRINNWMFKFKPEYRKAKAEAKQASITSREKPKEWIIDYY